MDSEDFDTLRCFSKHSVTALDALARSDIQRLQFRSDEPNSNQKRCVKNLNNHPDRTRYWGLPAVAPMRFHVIAEIVPEDGSWFAIEDMLDASQVGSASTGPTPALATTSVSFWVQGRIHDTAAAVQWQQMHDKLVQIAARFPAARTDMLFRVVEQTGMIRLHMQGMAEGEGFPIRGMADRPRRMSDMPLNSALRFVFILEAQMYREKAGFSMLVMTMYH